MVTNRSLTIIGPVGREQHIQTVHVNRPVGSGHNIALPIVRYTIRLGGSGFFALTVAQDLGIMSNLVTNTGDSTWVHTELAKKHVETRIADEATGMSSEYFSVWNRGTEEKQLYVRSAPDPSPQFIMQHVKGDDILVLSMQDPTTYIQLGALCSQSRRRLFIAPNQTLLDYPDIFDALSQVSCAIFFNSLETDTTSRGRGFTSVCDWYQSQKRTAALVVTSGGSSLSIITPNKQMWRIDLPTHQHSLYAVGGGDTFATIASATWGDNASVERLEAASRYASEILSKFTPFNMMED